jgi:phosphatidylglycerol:prolipoprotein diacylglycerol transferase
MMRIGAVRNRPGIVSGIFLLGYAAARVFIEFFREPDAQLGFIFDAVTMGQILCAPMALGGLFLLFLALHRDDPRISAGKNV